MNDRLEKAHQLLIEPNDKGATGTAATRDRDYSVLEPLLIIQEIVDDLQPLLSPYAASFYWYAFRHSIARDGNPLLRLSTRRLQNGVVKSNRSDTISLQQVRETLAALEGLGAIRKEGEPNRDGTPYRVLIPDEIEACQKLRAERKLTEPKPEITATDIDYYNVRENRTKVYERDGYQCRYCEKQLTRFTATLDHVKPVSEGGENGYENLVTACLDCNSRKHKRPVGDFLVGR
jgi:hypothetical protein